LRPAAEAAAADFALHYYLGAALEETKNHADAASEYRKATTIVPESAAAWFGLSVATLGLGQDAESDAALRRAAAVDPRPVWAFARARSAWRMKMDAAVIRDVDAGLASPSAQADAVSYAAILAAVSSWRLKQPDLALGVVSDARSRTDNDAWPARILDFALGKLDGAALVREAKGGGESTEARAYVGLRLLFEGRQDDAMTHLRWVRDRGDKGYVEYDMVVEVLTEIEKSQPKAR
jgi:tetratricopeptide (TPR) repeat protein